MARSKYAEAPIERDVYKAVEFLRHDSEIAVDLETSGLSPWKDKIAVVTLRGRESQRTAVLHVRGSLPTRLKDWMNEGHKFVGHNSTCFDALFLANNGVDIFKSEWYDTLTGELAVLAVDRRNTSVSLKASTQRRLGKALKRDIDHRTWMSPELNDEQLGYAADDVIQLFDLKDSQLARAMEVEFNGDYPLRRSLETEMALLPSVMRMMLKGLPISTTNLSNYLFDQVELIGTVQQDLTEAFGPIKLTSPVQVKKAFSAQGLELRSTDAATLMDLSIVGGPMGELAEKLLTYRHASQRLKMYTSEWVDKHVHKGWTHGRLWQLGTDTGRFSSSEPNLQQIPKDMRWVFEAPEGYSIVSADYSQIEVRVAASYAQDIALIAALEAEDIHREIASLVFNKAQSAVSEEERRICKAMVFTLIFGGGGPTFYQYARLQGSKLGMRQTFDIISAFFDRFTGLARIIAKAREAARTKRHAMITLPTGLRRSIGGASLTSTRLLNTRIQGSAAAGLKFGLLEVHKRGLDKYLGATVHDELVGIVPTNEAYEFGRELEDAMIYGMSKVIPTKVKVGVKIGQAWGPRPEKYALKDGKAA